MPQTLTPGNLIDLTNMLNAMNNMQIAYNYNNKTGPYEDFGGRAHIDYPEPYELLDQVIDLGMDILLAPMMWPVGAMTELSTGDNWLTGGVREGLTFWSVATQEGITTVVPKGIFSASGIKNVVAALGNAAGYNLTQSVINSVSASIASQYLGRPVSEDELDNILVNTNFVYDEDGIRTIMNKDVAQDITDKMAAAGCFSDDEPEELTPGEQQDTGLYNIPACNAVFTAMLNGALEQFYEAFDEGDLPTGTGLGDCMDRLDSMLERLPAIPENALATVGVCGHVGGSGTMPYFDVTLAVAESWPPFVSRSDTQGPAYTGNGYQLKFRTTTQGTDTVLATDTLAQSTLIPTNYYRVRCTKVGENNYEISTGSSSPVGALLIAGGLHYTSNHEYAQGQSGNLFTNFAPELEGSTAKTPDEEGFVGLLTKAAHDISTFASTWLTMSVGAVDTTTQEEDDEEYISINLPYVDRDVVDDSQARTQSGVLRRGIDYADDERVIAPPVVWDGAKILNPNWSVASIANPDVASTADPDPKPTPSPVVPVLPVIGTSARLYTVHKCNATELNTLGSYLWSQDFLSVIEKMFTQPIDAIIGLHTLYHAGLPLGASGDPIKLGSVTAGTATGTLITNQYCQVDCGSVAIPEFYGNVEDYQPYSKAEIFLPFIGFKEIDINDIMGGSVYVKYGVDIFTGACVATIGVMRDHVSQALYAFEGNCAVQQPVTSADYSRIVSGLITVAAGLATGGTGAAVLGAGTLLSGAHRISYPRSGSIGANTGAYLQKTPYILIRRPLAFNADNYAHYYGNPTKWTVTLGQCSGYTRVEDMHLDAIQCTDEERREIERLLKLGVMM